MSDQVRLKRLLYRASYRGFREADRILGPFAAACAPGMDTAALSRLEALLDERDHDIYDWVSGAAPAPEVYQALIAQIAAFMAQRSAP